ncbi:hypothetical protein C8Q76DRAFT_598947, partial [Earliella scabrosa]
PHTTIHPFTKPTADVILRSVDKIEFRVHKLILSEASPVFEGMWSLPQPSGSRPSDDSTALSVVDLPETGRTLNHLLRICYPFADPVLDSIDDIARVVETATKYEMKGAIARGAAMLNERCSSHQQALKTYVAASRLGLVGVAQRAA